MNAHCFFFNDTATTEIYTLSLHDALPIWLGKDAERNSTYKLLVGECDAHSALQKTDLEHLFVIPAHKNLVGINFELIRSEEHTSELQSPCNLVCRLLLEKKKQHNRSPFWL